VSKLTVGLVLLASVYSVFAECVPQNARPTDLVSFLEGAGSGQENAECVTLLIDALGKQAYAPAIPVLIKFLDFRRPRTEREKLGLHVQMRGFYPAVNALEQIGDEALPAVLNVIKTLDLTGQGRTRFPSGWRSTNTMRPRALRC